MSVSEASYHKILTEMYNELRAYREKEFRTFLFAFPIIGSAFVSTFTSRAFILMVSLFGLVVTFYFLKNIQRSMKIRRVILAIQDKLELSHDLLEPLNPRAWANKKLINHLALWSIFSFCLLK